MSKTETTAERMHRMSNMFMDLFNYTNDYLMKNLPPNDNIYDILDKIDEEKRIQADIDYYNEIDKKYEERVNNDKYYDMTEEPYYNDYDREIDNESSSSSEEDEDTWTTV